ncbi:hypothetical protein GE118_03345 [Mycoplasma sp. NEAQ87857]|uniref:hypothetical protein n=1 Tax=Mycoplasma sp. NEAQ87857 TaxID=2683967 RepID=UPI001318CC84|nr:hypothetical protein [Mycoplasma sp. NEAQ87857]QGZ97824.1 hypothetical protein GE118_03345 [Mycoplasma sp. NEAQ87857]
MNLKKYLINALSLSCVAIAPIAAIACSNNTKPTTPAPIEKPKTPEVTQAQKDQLVQKVQNANKELNEKAKTLYNSIKDNPALATTASSLDAFSKKASHFTFESRIATVTTKAELQQLQTLFTTENQAALNQLKQFETTIKEASKTTDNNNKPGDNQGDKNNNGSSNTNKTPEQKNPDNQEPPTTPKTSTVNKLVLLNDFSTKDQATNTLNSAFKFVDELIKYMNDANATNNFEFTVGSKDYSYSKQQMIDMFSPTLDAFKPGATHGTTTNTVAQSLNGKLNAIKDKLTSASDYNNELKEELESDYYSFFDDNLHGILTQETSTPVESEPKPQPSLSATEVLTNTMKTLGYNELNEETLNQLKQNVNEQFNALNLFANDFQNNQVSWASENKTNALLDPSNLIDPKTSYANLPELPDNKKAMLLDQLETYTSTSNAIAALFNIQSLQELGQKHWLIPLNKVTNAEDKFKDGEGLHIRKLEDYIIFGHDNASNFFDNDKEGFNNFINNLASKLSLNDQNQIVGGDLAIAQERAMNLLNTLGVSDVNEQNVKNAVKYLYNQYLNRAKVLFWYQKFATLKTKDNQVTNITFDQVNQEIKAYQDGIKGE